MFIQMILNNTQYSTVIFFIIINMAEPINRHTGSVTQIFALHSPKNKLPGKPQRRNDVFLHTFSSITIEKTSLQLTATTRIPIPPHPLLLPAFFRSLCYHPAPKRSLIPQRCALARTHNGQDVSGLWGKSENQKPKQENSDSLRGVTPFLPCAVTLRPTDPPTHLKCFRPTNIGSENNRPAARKEEKKREKSASSRLCLARSGFGKVTLSL